jgi:putative SOS response-associated peptidase YedK
MCGRFQASRSAEEVARWFETTGPLPNLRQRYNAAPTQDLAVVLRDNSGVPAAASLHTRLLCRPSAVILMRPAQTAFIHTPSEKRGSRSIAGFVPV